MAIGALVVYLIWAVLAFGLRTWVQWRRTGDSGFRGAGLVKGSMQWWARILFTGALLIGAAGPIAALTGLPAVGALDHAAVRLIGIALAAMVPNAIALFGLVLTVVAIQVQVRAVEEAYLLRAHGDTYTVYAARVGRFLPGLGRLTSGPRR